MKKPIIIIIILIIPVVILASTWFISNKTEAVFDKMLTVSQKKFAEDIPFLKVKKKSFAKGFLNSTASSIVTVEADKISEQQAFDLTLNHAIYHGPVMITPNGLQIGSSSILTTLNQQDLPSKIKQAIRLVFNGKQPISSTTHSDFLGHINVGLEIAPVNFDSVAIAAIFGKESKNPTKVTFEHLSSQFTTDASGSFLEGLIDFGTLKIIATGEKDKFNLVVDESIAQFNIDELYKGSMLLGSAQHVSPGVSFSNEDINISLKNVTLKSVIEDQNGFFNELVSIDAEKVLIQPTATAPVFPESKVHLDFAINGLTREASERLIDAARALSRNQLNASKDQSPEQLQAAITKDLINYFKTMADKVFKQGVEIKQAVKISTAMGSSGINFNSNYMASKNLLELKTIGELVKAFKLDFLMTVDKSMVAGTAAAEVFNNPMIMGFAVEDEKTYQLSANLNNGYLELNGQPNPALQMIEPMFKQPLNWDALLEVKSLNNNPAGTKNPSQ